MRDVSGKHMIKWALAGLMTLLVACNETGDTVVEGDTQVDITPRENPVDPSTIICDPFDSGSEETSRTQGIVAHLSYLTSDQSPFQTVADYLTFGTHVDEVDLFFNNISIPTRPFDRGFVTQSGATIQTLEGDTLYEYFALSFKGQIHRGSENPPGAYQFALLSDDGAVLKMSTTDGTMAPLVDNDGDHPTRMACASEPVYFDGDNKIPFEIDYYQGPRFHISLMVMWRPWPADEEVDDVWCGQEGNSLFFDSTQDPPAPQAAFNDLTARGWSVLDPSNYSLPEQEGEPTENPCNAPAPVVFNFEIVNVTTTSATLSWRTDIPASSQIVYTNILTSEAGQTEVDTSLKTEHTMTVTGLTANTFYSMKAVSASSSGRSSESAALSVRTRR